MLPFLRVILTLVIREIYAQQDYRRLTFSAHSPTAVGHITSGVPDGPPSGTGTGQYMGVQQMPSEYGSQAASGSMTGQISSSPTVVQAPVPQAQPPSSVSYVAVGAPPPAPSASAQPQAPPPASAYPQQPVGVGTAGMYAQQPQQPQQQSSYPTASAASYGAASATNAQLQQLPSIYPQPPAQQQPLGYAQQLAMQSAYPQAPLAAQQPVQPPVVQTIQPQPPMVQPMVSAPALAQQSMYPPPQVPTGPSGSFPAPGSAVPATPGFPEPAPQVQIAVQELEAQQSAGDAAAAPQPPPQQHLIVTTPEIITTPPTLRPLPTLNPVPMNFSNMQRIPLVPPKLPIKTTYEINYCDMREFPDTRLAELSLARIDYFVYNTSCSSQFFQCSIGQTFVLTCPSDDQAFDPAISSCNFKNSVRICPQYDHVLHCTIRDTCSPLQFACCAQPQQCIDLSRRCDGHRDCADGDDENNCPSCARNEFACVQSGKCISAKQRCDGKPDDCGDGTNLDEIGCSKNETCWGKFVCDSQPTLLAAGHSECIDIDRHCDGKKDCPGGEDEMHCRMNDAKYLLCENQKQSVTKAQWCNGKEECLDGSDEKYCY